MLFDYLRGFIKYRVQMQKTEKFLNSLCELSPPKNVSLSGENIVEFTCFCCDEKIVEDLLLSMDAKVLKKKTKGFPLFYSKLKKRLGLITGFAIAVALVFASTFFVWDIRVEGNEKLTDEQIIGMLEKAGFSKGCPIRKTDVKRIANKVLINEDALSWIAINFEGTVATAEVKEASIEKKIVKKENVNIVASNNGVIMRVDALDGDAKVKKGEVVYKGQLLISSFSDKRTGGSILKGAKGYVWATTERKFRVYVPLVYYEKQKSERENVSVSLSFLGKSISFPITRQMDFENSTISNKKTNMAFGKKYVLPLECVRMSVKEYIPIKKRRTQSMALEIAQNIAKERLSKSSPEFRTACVSEDYITEGDVLVYTCTFEGVENIAKELEFELS